MNYVFQYFKISTWRCEGFLLCKRSKSTIYWDNIASIWKYLEFCRWSKLKILPEQSHFANGSPAQPSLHSQSGCPLTMPWSNCMHNNSWTFFVPCNWHFRHKSLAHIPHSHQQVVVVAVACCPPLWNTFIENLNLWLV